MNIALCISGQPRGIPNALDYLIDNVIKPNDIQDIFMHTWYHPSLDGKPFDSAQPAQEDGRLGNWSPNTDAIIRRKLGTDYNLACLSCEHPRGFDQFSDLPGRDSAVQTKMASIFYTMWKCNEIKKIFETTNNFEYDIVIRTRLDLFYRKPVIIKKLLQEGNIKNEIFVPEMYQYPRQNDSYPISTGGTYSSLADTFAFGNSENMNKFCSVYPNFREIHGKIWPTVYGEAYLGYQVRGVNNIPIRMCDIEYDIMHRIMDVNKL